MTRGSRVGTNFILAPDRENRIGRGIDCHVILSDPLCSRVHAVLFRDEQGWWLQDAGSRNGTFLNGQRADEARLIDSAHIRVGSTEFDFHESQAHPDEGNLTQTIICNKPFTGSDSACSVAELPQLTAQHLEELYELSLHLLGSSDPDEAVSTCLQMLQRQVRASFLAFLWVSDDGRLKPRHLVPPDSIDRLKFRISDNLTELVLRQRRAVWVADQPVSSAGASSEARVKPNRRLQGFADGICVPLLSEGKILGALHAYREETSFSPIDFDYVCSVARTLGVTLARTRQQVSLRVDHQRLREKYGGFDELIGESQPMQDLKSRIVRVAQAAGCVLIRGESGSGKELVARAIHKASPRADRALLAVNCAAIPRELMESQLFGHKRGAFTGAESDHVGWFEQAESGTLFLDEVGELTLEGQAKLLRILDGHPFLPVGSTKEVSVDVRVIAATNRDLSDFVREGRFREDLYYRLSVFELHVPPLRDRDTDLERLVDFFLEHFRAQHGRPQLQLTAAARKKLLAYPWPGNVRQLRNVLDSAVVMAEGEVIESADLGLRDAGIQELDTLRIDLWECRLIREAMERTQNNISEAAKLLGIGRATLYRKLDELKAEA
jgi:two-component system, NtrC family, response regulator HydG